MIVVRKLRPSEKKMVRLFLNTGRLYLEIENNLDRTVEVTIQTGFTTVNTDESKVKMWIEG
mgnify:CR=1 FL=1